MCAMAAWGILAFFRAFASFLDLSNAACFSASTFSALSLSSFSRFDLASRSLAVVEGECRSEPRRFGLVVDEGPDDGGVGVGVILVELLMAVSGLSPLR